MIAFTLPLSIYNLYIPDCGEKMLKVILDVLPFSHVLYIFPKYFICVCVVCVFIYLYK